MIPPEIRRVMRVSETGENLSPAEYFQKLSNLLTLAPVEEWLALVPQMATGSAVGTSFAGPHSQRLAAKEMAVVAFAAQEVARLKTDMTPTDALAVLVEIKAKWASEGKGDPLHG